MIRQDNANESIRADDEFQETKGTPFSKARCPISAGEKAAAGERNDALSATQELPVSVKMYSQWFQEEFCSVPSYSRKF
ncbi:uncharacterized protein TNIN_58801 [Trichonephila inaurata madagascariensis]|uniref:Uncharacterized protein n=1 Tax=Trichonephila inaurata madagascariensis TaxID=2747483 RepID=A0A8X6IBH9_9ARAC|nr:uncharacterized protein TNIN_58801 [Trichonephila inaurata madagascariensis]